jgi:hypothetical protein
MLSKLVSRQIINHGLRLTTRAASASAQKKPVIQRKPDVKYQKVCQSLKSQYKLKDFFNYYI